MQNIWFPWKTNMSKIQSRINYWLSVGRRNGEAERHASLLASFTFCLVLQLFLLSGCKLWEVRGFVLWIVHPLSVSSFQSLSCVQLCNPMDCSTPGFPVHHHLPELAQTHVHRVGDGIQPSHPLLSPSPPAFNHPQHQGLFQWVSSSKQVAKVLELHLQHQSFQWIFRTDFLYHWLVWLEGAQRCLGTGEGSE